MRYKTILILFLICFTCSSSAFAENDRYRVEILVLTHLDHGQQPREVLSLEDFSSAMDFLQPLEEDEVTDLEQSEPEQPPPASPDSPFGDQSLVDPAVLEAEALNAVVHVEEMGAEMQDAWRRLRLSGPFRPLQYLAWEQGSNPPFPTLRVHDSESVLTEDPWAEQRLAQDPAGMPLSNTGQAAAGAFEPIPGVAAVPDEDEPGLPDPIVYYRLDGTASLTRSRFLHLALAIEWREPQYAPAQAVNDSMAEVSTTAGNLAIEPAPASFLVHRLEQSRPVRSGRMEYFDGPVLGVLAWISNVTEPVDPAPID